MLKKDLIIVFLIIFFLKITPIYAALETYVVVRIDNQIITNYDIKKEYDYLSALNKQFQNLSKDRGMKLAKESLIREKIKKVEIEKYFDFEKVNTDLVNILITNLYTSLEIDNLNEFKEYLDSFDLNFNEVKKKINLEIYWNKLIRDKHSNMINIDIKKLKEKVQKKQIENQNVKEFDLYEILFQVDKQSELKTKTEEINKSIIDNGFKNTASIYSVSNTAKLGGYIGWIDQNKLSERILNKLKKTKIGDVTEPINLTNGFLILKINEIREKKISIDKEKLLQNLIDFEKERQLNQFSLSYFNKVKLNMEINE